MKTNFLYISKGWACQSLYDVDEKVLYNLSDLFKNPILFSLLTLYLDNRNCETLETAIYSLNFEIKESPVVLTEYTERQYETYVDDGTDDGAVV